MSDDGTPPPPPPPDLSPPPGYAAYQPSYAGAVTLRKVGGLRTATLVLLGLYVLAGVIQIAGLPAAKDAAEDFLAGTISEDDFTTELGVTGAASLLTIPLTIALAVLAILWLHRIVSNHVTLQRGVQWRPAWAIWSWFLPPLVIYALPMLVLRESWKAADPAGPAGSDAWRRNSVSPLVYVWWVLFGLVPAVFLVTNAAGQFGSLGQDAEDLAQTFVDDQAIMITQGVFAIASAVAWALLVRALTTRHAQLTGEARR